MLETILIGVGGFVGALLLSSFAEYFVHILMHWRIFLGRVHRDHHAAGELPHSIITRQPR